jgi:polysaccharide biosynthesis protein PslH
MGQRKPNILYLTQHLPIDQTYGAQIRVLNTIRLLQRIGNISIVLASSSDYDEAKLQLNRREFDIKRIVKFTTIPRFSLNERIRHEFSPSFLTTQYFHAGECDRENIIQMINEYDVIWIHTVRIANAFQIDKWPHSVLDVDDIPSRFYATSAKVESNTIRRFLDYRMSMIWKRREHLFKDRFAAVAVCSPDDRRYLGSDAKIQVIPNGFSAPPEEPLRTPSIPARLGFIGQFDYKPNHEGITWFIRDVWPRIKREAPDAHLRLIGKGSELRYTDLGPDIEGLGWVADTKEEIASWSAMIVPTHVGGGTRIKIAEGFARKCPIVSTSLGAFGYDVCNGKELLIANSAPDFASSCVLLLNNVELGKKIAEYGWNKYRKRWTWDAISESVNQIVSTCTKN